MKMVQLFRFAAPLLVLIGANAHAITNGQLDGNKHPEVGALVDYDSKGTAYAFCSGTLISPTVMLTAAHCNPESDLREPGAERRRHVCGALHRQSGLQPGAERPA
jgi:hypothetical protein